MLGIDSFFGIKNYNIYHYKYNIFERSYSTSDICLKNLLHELGNKNYCEPLPTITELVYEENTTIKIDSTTQLKSISIFFTHIFICYLVCKL